MHWADGGPTTLSNLTLLCRRHHRAVHPQTGRSGWCGEPFDVGYAIDVLHPLAVARE